MLHSVLIKFCPSINFCRNNRKLRATSVHAQTTIFEMYTKFTDQKLWLKLIKVPKGYHSFRVNHLVRTQNYPEN